MYEIFKNKFEENFNHCKNTEVVLENPKDNEISLNDLFTEDGETFTSIEITQSDVINAIKATKINSAPGPDSIPPILLHKSADVLANPLTLIMNKS